ncbi:zinc finger protein weckle [Drosophila grimshawi]|uniref:GH22499 n=1 Tax=Drosophila grimshawi TaxID=7222 RepID=B4JSI9_DROGR|nr:zinc finger protein weckle [Drosophila grimshawi]EDV94729.1 GH22499 [Drosophila grimshawi]
MTGSEAVASSGTGAGSTQNREASVWHQWCRLCAKEHPDNLNVYFRDGNQTWTSVLAVAIGKYFWVNIKMEDELSNVLCKECYTLVEDLIEFSERVNRVQTLFSRLQQAGKQATLDYNELRKDCGLQADEWKHFVSKDASHGDKADADTVDYMVESIDEDAETEIMTEIEENPSMDNEENTYESYVDQEDQATQEAVAAAYVEQEEYTNQEAYGEQEEEQIPKLKSTTTSATEEDVDRVTKTNLAENEDIMDGPYKCTSCNRSYKLPMAYKRHMAVVHGLAAADKDKLECKRCHMLFATEIQLTAHFRSHLPSKDKTKNACSYCPKQFTTAGALKRHIMCIHENVKPYICDCCGKGMKTITALNEHKLVHTDECPFECTVCHRRFKNKARLKIHSDTHTNDSYECNICGLKLNTRRTLNMHQLVHTDAKQYKCDVCGAAFKRGKTLKAHLILHTGIRPYKCNFCGRDFSNGSNCRMHKRKTHPKELAEEEARGVMRSTLLPMITELTEASKRVKKPAKPGTSLMHIRVTEEITDHNSTDAKMSEDELDEEEEEEEEPDNAVMFEIVDECP